MLSLLEVQTATLLTFEATVEKLWRTVVFDHARVRLDDGIRMDLDLILSKPLLIGDRLRFRPKRVVVTPQDRLDFFEIV